MKKTLTQVIEEKKNDRKDNRSDNRTQVEKRLAATVKFASVKVYK